MARIWTDEARARHAELMRARIRDWAPWAKSTGPKTVTGKKRSSLNAMKHGFRSAACHRLNIAMRRQRHFIRAVQAQFETLPKLTNELLKGLAIGSGKTLTVGRLRC